MASLAELQVGERWIYSPRLKLLERGQTPPPTTFDSSRTPAPGERVQQPRTLAELDVSAIAAALASPALAELPDDAIPADAAEAYAKGGAVGTMIVQRDRRIEELEGQSELLRQRLKAVERERDQLAQRNRRLEMTIVNIRTAVTAVDATLEQRPNAAETDQAPDRHHAEAAPTASKTNGSAGPAIGAERRPLAILAGVAPAGLSEAAWATLAGYKRTGGTWGTYKSRLRTAGAIEKRGELWHATETGVAMAGTDVERPPVPGPQLVEYWAGRVPGAGRMLKLLGGIYPRGLTRDALASELGMAAAGGTFGTYLSRLRSNGLVEDQGKRIRVVPALMDRQ